MHLLLATLLSTSILAPEHVSAASETFGIPPVPDGLPRARNAPTEGHWLDLAGRDGGEGVWLPMDLAKDVHMRLEFLERTPAMCQERLDWARRRCEVDVRSSVDVALADAGIERLAIATEPQGWPTWQVAIITVGAVVVGAALGGAVVVVAR